MKIFVNQEESFRATGSQLAIAATSNGYTLQYSVDGNVYNDYAEAIPANENLIISDILSGMYFRLAGNVDSNVTVRF